MEATGFSCHGIPLWPSQVDSERIMRIRAQTTMLVAWKPREKKKAVIKLLNRNFFEGKFFFCLFGFVFWPGLVGSGRVSFLFGIGIFWVGD